MLLQKGAECGGEGGAVHLLLDHDELGGTADERRGCAGTHGHRDSLWLTQCSAYTVYVAQ